ALRENLDQVKRNRELNALVTNLELPISLEESVLVNPDRNMVAELFDALEFDNIRNRVFTTFEQHLGSSEEPDPPEEMPTTAVIEDVEQWQTFLGNIEERISVFFHINPPATITRRKIPAPGDYGEIRAIGFATADVTAVIDLDNANAALGSAVTQFFSDQQYSKVVYDLKATLDRKSTRLNSSHV